MGNIFKPDDSIIVSIHDQLKYLHGLDIHKPGDTPEGLTLNCEYLSFFFETAFWASLRNNEGRPTRVNLIIVNIGEAGDAFTFSEAVPFNEAQVVKLAPAVPDGGCLAVNVSASGLQIWGISKGRDTFHDSIIAQIWGSGIIRVSIGSFSPFAILDGQENPIIGGAGRIDLANYLQNRLKKHPSVPTEFLETLAVWHECLAMADLAKEVLALDHGGAILIVPAGSDNWTTSISPFPFRFANADASIPESIRRKLKDGTFLEDSTQTDVQAGPNQKLISRPNPAWKFSVRSAAALSEVDGAIIITSEAKIIGFGAKINVGETVRPQIHQYYLKEGKRETINSSLEVIGGTRHQSTAKFVATHQETLAIVISQDRHISILHWEPEFEAVAVLRDAETLA
ncbi:MAG: putative sensor domain DACNV-containing protein [Rectinemataceae bacterium]